MRVRPARPVQSLKSFWKARMSNRSAPWPAPARLAFPAMLIGSASLAFGPWMVRLADVGPIASAFWRLIIAAPLLVLLCRMTGQGFGRLSPALLLWIALGGLFFALDLMAWHGAIMRTTLGNAVLFGNMTSFIFAAYGFMLARRLPGRMVSAALLLAAAGTLLLLGRSYQASPVLLAGDGLALLAAMFYTVYLIAMSRARGAIASLPALALASVVGAAVLLLAALLLEGRLLPSLWWPLIVLALSSQILGQGLVVFALPHLTPVVAGMCLLIQPVIAATIGWTMFGEHMAAPDLLGAAMVLVALVLIRWRG